MNARLRCCLLAVFLAALAGGCRWAREVTWDLSARENEPGDRWVAPTPTDPIDQDIKPLLEERARNEATFLARNPGAKPPGAR
jgi:hypothetical protein